MVTPQGLNLQPFFFFPKKLLSSFSLLLCFTVQSQRLPPVVRLLNMSFLVQVVVHQKSSSCHGYFLSVRFSNLCAFLEGHRVQPVLATVPFSTHTHTHRVTHHFPSVLGRSPSPLVYDFKKA